MKPLVCLFLFSIAATACLAATVDAQILPRNRRPATVVVPLAVQPAAPAAPAAPTVTEGHRLLFDMARARAAGQLARKKGISRAEARDLIDDAAPDEVLMKLSAKAGLKFKGLPGGGLTDFLDWLIAHQDQLMALIKLILALFGI